jgi:hypothetical protein
MLQHPPREHVSLTNLISGQEAPRQGGGLPNDWSHRHLIFSNAGSFADATKNSSLLNRQKGVFHYRQAFGAPSQCSTETGGTGGRAANRLERG